ncbi:MAG TPA: amino acid transporter, partial [Alphaproteobacteria bacterium]|nr:amino acid transporter [Alphaproteobacteria bacterium]
MDELNWPLILGAGLVASASPGPATLALAGTSMRHGRQAGLLLAAGIMTGSYIWSITAAFGVGVILLTHVWILEIVRYCGAAYLIYLAS